MKIKSTLTSIFQISLLLITVGLHAQSFTETFLTAPPATWNTQNLSNPTGVTTWAQGAFGTWSSFDLADGIGNDYAFANYNATGDNGTISCWMISPNVTTLSNGDTISFYTRSSTTTTWPDRMQVRVSTNGASTNVGATEVSVGDFTYSFLDINPTYVAGGYPTTWTPYTIILSGLPAGNLSGRVAFRYFVENAGAMGVNSNAIGVDLFHYGNQASGGGTLTTGTVSPLTYCAGSPVSVPFSSSGITFLGGNTFIAQLSDGSGNFTSPTIIGILSSTSASGTISATIPASASPGGFYRIRVVATTPSTTGIENTSNVIISRNYPPVLFANPGTSVCSGSVTLSAIPFERFYGYDALGGNFVRFDPATPGTLVTVAPAVGAYYSGDFGPDGYYVLDYTTNAYSKVNITTGAVINIGTSTPNLDYSWSGLAWNPVLNNFFAVAANSLGDTSQLYSINFSNGAATYIGELTNCPLAIWLAINNSGAAYALDIASDNLISVNLSTAAGTLVGSVGFDANYAQDADFDPVTGILYLSAYNNTSGEAELRTANLVTGATTLIGGLGATPANTEVCALAIAGYSSYSWSPGGATTSSINVTSTGTYTVTVTNVSGCSASASQAITVGAANPSISPANPSICNGGSVTLTASGGNSYSWSTGGGTTSISVSSAGTYTVTVTGNGGCTASASVSVTVGTTPTASISPSNPSVCNGSSVTLTASGGNSYSWSTGGGTAAISVGSAGSYTVTVTGNGGCTASASVSVSAGTTPTVSISPSNPTVCAGSSVTLTASGGNSYSWSGGGGTAAISVGSVGAYTVTVTGNGGCTASASVSVGAGTSPTASISPSNPSVCSGNSVTLTASGGNSYSWSTGGNTAAISAANTGTYTVTVTGNGGCTASASVSVTAGTTPSASITPGGNTTFCQGGNVMLTAGGGASYLWSTGSSNAAVVASTSGLYVVTVTSANGCTASASQNVVVNSATATITPSGSTNICLGSSVTLTASGGLSYQWSNGPTTSAITVNSTGTFTVVVTDANTCTATASQSVSIQTSTATITPSGPTTFCQGSNVTLSATTGNTYIWSNGGNTNSINTGITGIYSVTVTFTGGCSATASQQVTVNSAPTVVLNSSSLPVLCPSQSITFTASGGTSYLWSTGSSSNSITVNAPGTYSVTATNASGCSASVSQSITSVSNPNASIVPNGSTTFCNGGSVMLTGNGGNTYLWSTGANTTAITASSTGIYSVTVTDQNGCSATASQTVVEIVPTASITANGPTIFCPGGNVTLTANNGSSYLWSVGSSNNSINVTTGGVYSVTVTDANSCTASASQTVTVDANPTTTITPSGSGVLCAVGGSEVLTAGSGTAYSWSTGATSQSVTVTTAGTYSVTVTISASCSATASEAVTQAAAINVTGTTTPSSGNNGAVNVTVSNAFQPTSYQWSSGQTTEDISGLAPGIYIVTVTDAHSCSATQTFNITPVGITETALFEIFEIFPNPATDQVRVNVKLRNAASGGLSVFDVYGKLILFQPHHSLIEFSTTLNTSQWAAGMYNVEFVSGEAKVAKKLVVIR